MQIKHSNKFDEHSLFATHNCITTTVSDATAVKIIDFHLFEHRNYTQYPQIKRGGDLGKYSFQKSMMVVVVAACNVIFLVKLLT